MFFDIENTLSDAIALYRAYCSAIYKDQQVCQYITEKKANKIAQAPLDVIWVRL
jgi:hypothetical protein